MDLDDSVTVTKVDLQGEIGYLMIGWQCDSFEMHLYTADKLWKGTLSSNRLLGFSKNLHKTEAEYMQCLKNCLGQERNDYAYEIKSGFFYWRRHLKDGSFLIEGFVPLERETDPSKSLPNLIEVILALNRLRKNKIDALKCRFNSLKADYQKCLKDTEEFLNLKIEMEKALTEKFITLLKIQRDKVNEIEGKRVSSSILNRIWKEIL